MKKRKKILYVHHAAGLGGAPISLKEIIDNLDADSFDVHVLLLKDSIVREIFQKEGISVSVAEGKFYKKYYRFFPHLEPEYFRWWNLRKIIQHSILWLLSRLYFAERLLKKFEFDILHLNSSVLTDFLKAGHHRGRVIIHVREPVAKGYLGLRRAVIRREIRRYCDRVIAISHDNSKRLGCESKTTVIYNFTKIEDTPTDPPLKRLVLYLGGSNKIKGFLTLVAALDYLDPSICILFCGYYPDLEMVKRRGFFATGIAWLTGQQAIEKAALKLRSHKNAKLMGLRQDIPDLLEQCDVLVNPFTIEHFSRPIIEAYAKGRTVVASNVQGIDEIVENNITGIIVKKSDPYKLAAALNRALNDPILLMRLAREGHARATDKFSEKNVMKIQLIYDELN